MKRKQLLYIFGIILCFVACKDVNEFDVVTIRETPQINVVADAKGVVLKEDGTPVQGAEIQVGNVFTSTNSRGEYEVRNATMAKGRGQIQISKNGFFKQISTASAQSGEMSYNKIILSERGQAQTFNTNNTETVNISGLNITFPSGSLKTNSGQVYSGDVNVFSKKISPNDDGFSNKMMADLVGKTKEFEKKVLLPALMMNLELETSSGVELNFDGEDGVILEFEVPSDLEDEMGEAIAWEYDTEDEFWLEEVECYPSSGSYQCTLGGTGPWACCIPIDGVEVTLNVVNSNNTAAKHVKVEYDDQNSYFVFGGYTNNRGTIIGTLPVSAEFDLSVEDLCENIVFTDVVGEFQEDITLPNANLTNTVEQFSINAEGSIEDCSSSLVTPSWVNMRYAGNEKNFKVDNLGNFDVDVFFNCIDFPDLEVTGYNYTDEQQSETVLHDYLSDVNVGNLSACESLTTEAFMTQNGEVPNKIFPLSYAPVWNIPENLEIKSEIPGGSLRIVILDYSGLGVQACNVEIIDNSSELPDYSAYAGVSEAFEGIEITSDDGEFITGYLTATMSGAFNMNISFTAKKR